MPTERSAKPRLSAKGDEVLKNISAILNEIIFDAIAKRTAQEFNQTFERAFPSYVKLVLSFAGIVSTMVSRSVLARIATESFCELEADLRENGVKCFGADMKDRAVFTVWTLRKISDLLEVLSKSSDVADDRREQDEDFAHRFLTHALRARFSVDCLTLSMQANRPIYPDVLPSMEDGLRSAVDAFAWVKQAVGLRFPSVHALDLDVSAVPWDDEDQGLLNASMRALAHDDQ